MKSSPLPFIALVILLSSGYFFFIKKERSEHASPNSTAQNNQQVDAGREIENSTAEDHNHVAAVIKPTFPQPDSKVGEVLNLMMSGQRIKDNPVLKNYIAKAVKSPKSAIEELQNHLKNIPEYEVANRGSVFGLLLEIGVEVKNSNPALLDEFVHSVQPLVSEQIASPIEVLASIPAGTNIEELVHHGPYKADGSQVFAYTFEAKFMAMAVLKETGNAAAKRYLMEISENSNYDPQIRELAGFHSQEQ